MHFSTGRGIIKTLAIFSCHRGVCITPLCSPTQFKGIDLQFTGLCLIKVNIEKPSLWSANLIKAWWNLSTPSGLRGAVIPEQQSSQSQSQSSGMCWGFFRRRRPPQPAALTDSSGIPGWVLMSWGFMLYLVSSPISSEFVFPLIYPKWKTLLLVLYGLCVNVKGLEPVFEWQLCLVFVCFFLLVVSRGITVTYLPHTWTLFYTGNFFFFFFNCSVQIMSFAVGAVTGWSSCIDLLSHQPAVFWRGLDTKGHASFSLQGEAERFPSSLPAATMFL